ncbi:phosphoadenylyl-sulfate reductase [Guptibacillus hwajinpoensis]|uniref:phosphoadenylyl-sulfate reductase n=1 Tax=Guptibacillus hwajinpoensis TaxID=208199 RepID=UPI001CFCF90E|nr:phosphoadenylyl-sulfate reductase [Pseudalkalibacillus hwajinpoensis]WLR60551.1 phosphoadenylyl-sulfate reductase [Pseudalkalibacillus hwajinpoensis]
MSWFYDNWSGKEPEFNVESETKGALEVLEWAYQIYQDDIVYACSFGVEGVVLIDLISRINQNAKIVFLDTGLHFDETYELINKVKAKYPSLNIKLKQPKESVAEQALSKGDALWERDPGKCCNLRKVIPLHEELDHVSAWISGLRREQSPLRQKTNYFNRDDKFQAIKVCPLIHWTWKDVWRYVYEKDLPYNPLHDKGYPSIGCAVCTERVLEGSDSRAGRWANQEKTECGLHLDSAPKR